MATLHLVFGPQGAGKSTHARNLTERAGAIHFAIDNWMIQLFGSDMPERPDMAWLMARVVRCEKLIWNTAAAILQQGSSVVLDIGLMKQAQRQAASQLARDLGFAPQWHYVTAPIEIRRSRVAQRNSQKGDSFAFAVSPTMFDMMEAHWEAPCGDELAQAQIFETA